MDKRETRRINPIAHIALIAVLLLIIFEMLVIFGAMELRAQTVAKYAPWAYEPFLKLVGEHPDSAPRRAAIEEVEEDEDDLSTVAGVAGLNPSAIPVLIETDEAGSATNAILEATVPTEAESDPVPVYAPTNRPPVRQEKVVPVG